MDNIYGSSIICLGATAIVILLGCAFKVENLLLYMLANIPFFNILNYKTGTTSMFYLLIIVFVVKYYFSKHEHYKIRTKTLIIVVLVLFSLYNLSVFETYIKWVLKFIPVILIYKEEWLYNNMSKTITYLTISAIISSAMGYILLNADKYLYTGSYVYSNGSSATRFAGLIGDSLVYSQFILIVMACNLIKIEKYKCNKTLCMLAIVILIAFGFFTYSKTYIALMLFTVFFYFIYKLVQYVREKKSYKFIIFCIICLIGCVIAVNYIAQNSSGNMISSYITRFTSSDLLTGRSEIYARFINLWKENPQVLIVGIGFEKYIEPYNNGTCQYSHNIYIETISLFGVLVFCILAIFIVKAIISYFVKKGDIIYLLPILILAISGFVLHGHLEFGYYFNIILAIIFFNLGKEEALNCNIKKKEEHKCLNKKN